MCPVLGQHSGRKDLHFDTATSACTFSGLGENWALPQFVRFHFSHTIRWLYPHVFGFINTWMVLLTCGWFYQHMDSLFNMWMVLSTREWFYPHVDSFINTWMALSTSGWFYQHVNGFINKWMVFINTWMVLPTRGWFYYLLQRSVNARRNLQIRPGLDRHDVQLRPETTSHTSRWLRHLSPLLLCPANSFYRQQNLQVSPHWYSLQGWFGKESRFKTFEVRPGGSWSEFQCRIWWPLVHT